MWLATLKHNYKCTNMITLKQFVDTLEFNCNLANVNVMCLWDSPQCPTPIRINEINDVHWKRDLLSKFDSNFLDYNDIYYKVYFAVDNSKIGFEGVQAYLDKDKNVIAADISKCRSSLINALQMFKTFNGVPYKHLGKSNEINGWIVYY